MDIHEVAKEMADAIREWNRAKKERESYTPSFGEPPPAHLLGNARKANKMLDEALSKYNQYISENKSG